MQSGIEDSMTYLPRDWGWEWWWWSLVRHHRRKSNARYQPLFLLLLPTNDLTLPRAGVAETLSTVTRFVSGQIVRKFTRKICLFREVLTTAMNLRVMPLNVWIFWEWLRTFQRWRHLNAKKILERWRAIFLYLRFVKLPISFNNNKTIFKRAALVREYLRRSNDWNELHDIFEHIWRCRSFRII